MGEADSGTLHLSWTEKYRPERLGDLTGHIKVIDQMKAWARSWTFGTTPKKKGLILEGEAGAGKTTAAFALASEMGWEVIELNASDSRNQEAIRLMATRGSLSHDITDSEGFSGKRSKRLKMILLDEADNLYERSASVGEGTDVGDRGGKRAIVELIKMTKQPVVLIVNDLYGLTSGSGQSLNFTCERIRFRRLSPVSISKRLREICDLEGIGYEDEVIKAIAERSGGDMRSAVGDLQIISSGKDRITLDDLDVLGFRDVKENIFGVLNRLFSASSIKESRSALMEVDEDINSLKLWVAENIQVVMVHPKDLDSAYRLLSKSDIYLGRVRRRQNYKLWSYAKDLLAAISNTRKHSNRRAGRYSFPSYLKAMSRTKDSRSKLKETASAIGRLTHTSIRYQKEDALGRIGLLCQRDPEFASHLIAETDLEKDHLKLLTGEKLDEKELRAIMKKAESINREKAAPKNLEGGLMDFMGEEKEETSAGKENTIEEIKDGEKSSPHQSSLFEF
jgi:replication factor C large subunit